LSGFPYPGVLTSGHSRMVGRYAAAFESAPVGGRSPCQVIGYIGLGWAAGAAVPAVWMRSGVGPALLLILGGLLYSLGALAYHHRRPDPAPAVFGYHEVFHLFATVAAACQYVAIACFLL